MPSAPTIWIVSFAAGFLLFRILTRRPSKPAVSDYEREINEILTDDKHKVKGRFE